MESRLSLLNKMISIIKNKTYADLVVKVLPTAIQSEKEYEIMLANIDELMSKGENKLSLEEERLLKTLAILVESYEDEHYPMPEIAPNEILKFLMEENDLKQKDLIHIFGSSGIASEIVNGKRSISKNQAKALAEFFRVSIEVFI
ncbi:MAG: transcriptional regulator [Acidobacteria bacterium]|nr:transcriptional regulator [Acidobacteriota bacterium]